MKRSLFFQLGGEGAGLSGAEGEAASTFDRWVQDVEFAAAYGADTIWCLPGLSADGTFAAEPIGHWLAMLIGRQVSADSAGSAGAAKPGSRADTPLWLGWGVAELLPPAAPPIRVAEQAASLDLACAGRLHIAVLPGEGDLSIQPAWDEGLRMLAQMWRPGLFAWASDGFEVPPVEVLPKPAQSPHPPLHLVGWSDDHARLAGRAGLGLLDVSGGEPATLEVHRDGYFQARAEAAADELLCHSAFAAAIEWPGASELAPRLAALEALGIDEVALRAEWVAVPSNGRASDARASTEEASGHARARIQQFLEGAVGASAAG